MDLASITMHSNVVLVKPIDPPSDSEIILLGTDEKVRYGYVEAVGPGRKHKKTGKLLPVGVEAGDTVVFGDNTGEDLTMHLNGENYLAMREEHIIGVIE